jgi:hypothetical protein
VRNIRDVHIFCNFFVVMVVLYSGIPKTQAQATTKDKRFIYNQNRTVTDKSTGLTWTHEAKEKLTWVKANQYCETLDFAGFADWRLPNIDELRSIVVGCPTTVLEGSCPIHDNNGFGGKAIDITKDNCGCKESRTKRDGAFYYNLYWDNSVWKEIRDSNTTSCYYRSSTPVTDIKGRHFSMDFCMASVGQSHPDSDTNVYCVR